MITNLRLINLLLPLLALVLAVAVWLQVDDWQRLTRQVKQNEVKLQQLQLGASRFVSVQASTKKEWRFFEESDALQTWLAETAGSHLLQQTQITAVDGKHVLIRFNQAQFPQLIKWLNQLQKTTNVEVVELSLLAKGQPDQVGGEIRLAIQIYGA
jgi:type II secretory pathway component PulM|tara:strand:+ start:14494 stop:14958 length:465 start_codon:yes stop_codon:yes gene_type:complete